MTAADLRANSAQLIDLSVRFETLPLETEVGPILWADVQISYALAGLSPTVNIRIPVPFEAGQSDGQRKAKALRSARLLIDHACQAAGVRADRPVSDAMQEVLEGIIPASLEGVAQELGLVRPTAKPKP